MPIRIVYYCLPIMMMSLCHCTKSTPPEVLFGTTQNPNRKPLNLPTLDPTWRIASAGTGLVMWSSEPGPNPAPSYPCYFAKVVTYQGSTMTDESDQYTNGKRFLFKDPDRAPVVEAETLQITYDYSKAKAGNPWKCEYFTADDARELNLSDAEALLKTWGLKRLNY